MRSLDAREGGESAGGARDAGFKKIDNFLTDQLARCYCFSESDGQAALAVLMRGPPRASVSRAANRLGNAPQAIEIAQNGLDNGAAAGSRSARNEEAFGEASRQAKSWW
jgi:hypothetical protein